MDEDALNFLIRAVYAAEHLEEDPEFKVVGKALKELVYGFRSPQVELLLKCGQSGQSHYKSIDEYSWRVLAHAAVKILVSHEYQFPLIWSCKVVSLLTDFSEHALKKEFQRSTSNIADKADVFLKRFRSQVEEQTNNAYAHKSDIELLISAFGFRNKLSVREEHALKELVEKKSSLKK